MEVESESRGARVRSMVWLEMVNEKQRMENLLESRPKERSQLRPKMTHACAFNGDEIKKGTLKLWS